jgi:glycosyltransferase involved in cell wall biosynthesis
MALALSRLAADDDTRESLRRGAVGWVRERFSWDALVPRYMEVLEAC